MSTSRTIARGRGSLGAGLRVGHGHARSVRRLRQVGLASRAAVYAILAILAGDIALHGSAPARADSQGALVELAKQPEGPVLLGFLAAGLLAYALWRLTQVLSRKGTGQSRRSPWMRVGWAAAAAIYLGLCVQAVSILLDAGSGGGPSSHPRPLVAAVLGWGGGQVLVGLVGFGIAFGGIALAVWGCVHDYDKVFETGRMSRRCRRAARLTGTGGEITRGLLVLLVSIYLITAAVTDQPGHVKTLGGSIAALAHDPFGTALLALTALGLLMFAVYSCFEAAYGKA